MLADFEDLPKRHEKCTFSRIDKDSTLYGHLISEQDKEAVEDSVDLYIVRRWWIKDRPTILVLAYPGELLGYGMWSTDVHFFAILSLRP